MNNTEQLAYKIFEEDEKGTKTLFHGVSGSRILSKNAWLEADEKLVSDGTSKTRYTSGFHVLLTEKDAEDYLKCFTARTNKLKIKPVLVRGLRSKEHSRSPVFLAKWMKLEI